MRHRRNPRRRRRKTRSVPLAWRALAARWPGGAWIGPCPGGPCAFARFATKVQLPELLGLPAYFRSAWLLTKNIRNFYSSLGCFTQISMDAIPLKFVPQLSNEYVFYLLGHVYLICWSIFVHHWPVSSTAPLCYLLIWQRAWKMRSLGLNELIEKLHEHLTPYQRDCTNTSHLEVVKSLNF